MTSDKAQIQALINEIDEALNKTSPRLPWVMSNDAAQQRQVLEQTRQYLAALQQQTEAEHLTGATSEEDIPRSSAALEPSPQSSSESAQQVLQAVLQEMNYWRVNMLQPLRTEIDSLQRQREMLTQEIRQLETQRHQHSLGSQPSQNQQLLMEFLQSAMAQMQANLSAQVTQMIASQTPSGGQPALPGSASIEERLAQMQRNQLQSDQLMLKLDSTLQVIFESLRRNVQTYEESLEQGLTRMHSLGQQGEAMFAFLVNRLAQQLGREASTFLQSTASTNWQPSSLPETEPQRETPVDTKPTAAKTSDFLSHISNPTQTTFVPAVPFDLSEEVLDVSELELLDQPEQLDQPVEQSALDSSLEGLDLELSQLDLTGIPTPEPTAPAFDLFAGDQPLPNSSESVEVESANFSTPTSTSDLDSALDLLNQISAEMQTNLAMGEETPPTPPPARLHEPELIATPDSLYDDAFYSNLFQGAAGNVTASEVGGSAEGNPVDAMTLEQAWFDGLGDPAAETRPAPTPQPDFSQNLISQSLENFLLSNPAPTPVDTDLLAEFAEQFADSTTDESGQVASAAETPVESTNEPFETIASLTDLISTNSGFSEIGLHGVASETESETESETASTALDPQELPIAEAATEDLTVDLGSGADSLAQLGDDLGRPLPSRIAPELIESGWDVSTDSPNAALSNITPPKNSINEPISDPPPVTIEGLEELFEALPDAEPLAEETGTPLENSAQIEATPDLFTKLKAAFSQDAGIPLEVEQPIVLRPIDPESFDDPDFGKKK